MLKSYVKRTGYFTGAQRKAYNELSCKYLIPVLFDNETQVFDGAELNFNAVFNNCNDVIMEIGFGSGAATAQIAKDNTGKNYLGIEVHKPGIGRLLWEIEKNNLSNIRIIEFDAMIAVSKLIKEGSLGAIHIFFPDPWPKKRHHKRRLIQKPFTNTLAGCLKQGGYIYMVTDWEDYGLRALEELSLTKTLKNAYDGFAEAQAWRPKTRFEQKGLDKNHVIRELLFIKG